MGFKNGHVNSVEREINDNITSAALGTKHGIFHMLISASSVTRASEEHDLSSCILLLKLRVTRLFRIDRTNQNVSYRDIMNILCVMQNFTNEIIPEGKCM